MRMRRDATPAAHRHSMRGLALPSPRLASQETSAEAVVRRVAARVVSDAVDVRGAKDNVTCLLVQLF